MTTWAVSPSQTTAKLERDRLVTLFLAVIAAVSVYDTWLTYRLRDVILGTEENPICVWLIRLEPDQLSVFVPCKLLGTAFVVAVCCMLYRYREAHGVIVAGAIATFQGWLLCYLQL